MERLLQRANIEIDPRKPFRLYLNSAGLLLRQAITYDKEHELESAFILYMKYCTLIISKLPRHPGFQPDNQQYLFLRKNCTSNLDRMEELKRMLKEHYARVDDAARREMERQSVSVQPRPSPVAEKPASDHDLYAGDWWKSDQAGSASAPVTHSQTAVQAPSRPQVVPAVHLQSSPIELPPPVPKKTLVKPDAAAAVGPEPEYYSPHGPRTMHLPSRTVESFLQVARKNTSRNLETCALLCGTLKQNRLYITHLIFPPQTSTSDTCQVTDDLPAFLYQEEHNLMTLGWIHTHPSQSCFLSSVDLHTHAGYQLMLPEAIAIVCAPSYSDSLGVFRMTDPPGVQIVSECRLSGFHQHPQSDNLYARCSDVVETKADVQVVDLR
ncbi:hypothetical protein HDU91_004843 [Kappamyces sp. JEL0680]|nr:hypothetical protein HDU91_004843 [Kappamyces sp. JEL0680]